MVWPFKAKREVKETDISAYTWAELLGHSGSAKAGVSVNLVSALRVSTVLACARVIAEGVAQLPVKVFHTEGDTRTPATELKVYNVLARRPNDWMTSFEMREQMTLHAVLAGNSYAFIGTGQGEVQELIPLVPGTCTPIRGNDYTLTYRVTNPDGTSQIFPAEDILHLKGPSWNGFTGMDPIAQAREAIGLAIATEETHSKLHANGAMPGGVLTVKGKLDADGKKRLKESWQAFQGGMDNKFKTAVVDMDADWKAMTATGVDSQHLETRRFQIEEICRFMRVFPQMVMHTDKTATFASAESFFLAHVVHCLMPWIARWEQTIEHRLLNNDPSLICKMSVAALLRGDSAARSDFYMKALGGARGETAYMTRNEVRALEDLNPIEGGDKLLIPVVAPAAAPPGTDPNVASDLTKAGTGFFLTA